MHDVKQHLISKLDAACELAQRSEPSLYSGSSPQKAVEALTHIRGQLTGSGKIDFVKAGLLFAPTGLLHELSMDNDWGHRFLQLASDVEELLAQLKDQA